MSECHGLPRAGLSPSGVAVGELSGQLFQKRGARSIQGRYPVGRLQACLAQLADTLFDGLSRTPECSSRAMASADLPPSPASALPSTARRGASSAVDRRRSASSISVVRLPARRSLPAGLPVFLGVAEGAEHVVAPLEGLAHRVRVALERRTLGLAGTADDRAEQAAGRFTL